MSMALGICVNKTCGVRKLQKICLVDLKVMSLNSNNLFWFGVQNKEYQEDHVSVLEIFRAVRF